MLFTTRSMRSSSTGRLRHAVVIERVYPTNQLGSLLDVHAVGAWISERNNAYRFGFNIYLDQIQPVIQKYRDSCAHYVQAPAAKNLKN